MNMMQISKNKKEPEELREYRKKFQTEGSLTRGVYDRFRENRPTGFERLQDALLIEQHNLCCYCMKKIQIKKKIDKASEEKPLTIEHYEPKDTKPDLSLTYTNLLACCDGKDGVKKFCGDNKGNKPLIMIPNPADVKEAEGFIKNLEYKSNGEITVKTSYLKQYSEKDKTILFKEINEILNLNDDILTKARTTKLEAFINRFKDEARRKSKKITRREFFTKSGHVSYHAFVESRFLNKFIQ